MRILVIGDIVGRPGRRVLTEQLTKIKKDLQIDVCIANGENAATGNGITEKVAREIYNAGVDIITLGNHTWSKKQISDFIDNDHNMVRPANFINMPGNGHRIFYKGSYKVGVINLCGITFLNYKSEIESPFTAVDREIEELNKETDIVLVDFHAEATSEKIALGWYLDGRVTAVFGTHTHVQTCDERVLDNGTGYITDIGMTGPYNSVLGLDINEVIKKFTSSESTKFIIAEGDVQLNGAYFDIDDKGKCRGVERVRIVTK